MGINIDSEPVPSFGSGGIEMQMVRITTRTSTRTDDEIANNEGMPACFKSLFQEICCVLTTTMAVAMGALLGGAVTVVSAKIGKDLHMTTAELTWLPSSSAYVFLSHVQTSQNSRWWETS